MVAPYIPILKTVLPFLAPLVTAAAPILTRSSDTAEGERASEEKRITELQKAVANNADALKILATQLQKAIEAFDERESSDLRKITEIHSLVEAKTAETIALKGTVEAAVRDIQTTKLVSLAALGLALAALAAMILK